MPFSLNTLKKALFLWCFMHQMTWVTLSNFQIWDMIQRYVNWSNVTVWHICTPLCEKVSDNYEEGERDSRAWRQPICSQHCSVFSLVCSPATFSKFHPKWFHMLQPVFPLLFPISRQVAASWHKLPPSSLLQRLKKVESQNMQTYDQTCLILHIP